LAKHLREGETPPLLQVLPDAEALAHRAAELFVMAASSSISSRGFFSVAFSGGSTPRRLFELLALEQYRAGVQWDKVHVFFVDERCVPPDHELSNFKLARDTLLIRVKPIVHRIHGELGPEEAASRYSEELVDVLGQDTVLDLVFLGMGEDGHTASLFPGAGGFLETVELTVPVTDREPSRVSLALHVINRARTVIFHVTGKSKAATVKRVLAEDVRDGSRSQLPAGLVTWRALWLLDQAAASEM